ncbi:MAG TPA: hypothetical protein VGR45_09585 [Stellaceae bacterium]|nr:hypothetical protein [Stellaceae bacterium]
MRTPTRYRLTARMGGRLLAVSILGPVTGWAAQPAPAPIQLLPQPGLAVPPVSPPAPLAPPINPGYAVAPANGLSPRLTQPGPVYESPAPANVSYPPQQLPGPIDQQKLQSYRNDLRSRQWQLQRQGVAPSSTQYSRELQQQLSPPDDQ